MDNDELIAIVLCHLWVMFYVAYQNDHVLLTVLASLWRFKSLDITLCDTPN
jgi:hypothetical protein